MQVTPREGLAVSVVAPRDPIPVNNGLSERLYQLATHLGQRCDVRVRYPRDPTRDASGREPTDTPFDRDGIDSRVIEPLERAVPEFSPLRGPYQCHPWLYPGLRRRFTRHPPAVVVVEFPYLVPVVRAALRGLDVPVVLSAHNVEHRFARRVGIPLWRGLAAFERAACRSVDAVVAVSETDRETLAGHVETPVVVAPNGVDTARYEPGAAARAPEVVTRGDPTLVYHGNLANAHNAEAVTTLLETFPTLRDRLPNARLVLVGPNPPDETPANVVTTGLVDDLPAYLAGADVAVAPLASGSGTSLKIIEYLASGTPVVTTPIGAEGLPLEHETHALLGPPEKLVEPTERVVTDDALARRLSEAGRTLAVSEFGWGTTLAPYDELLARLTG